MNKRRQEQGRERHGYRYENNHTENGTYDEKYIYKKKKEQCLALPIVRLRRLDGRGGNDVVVVRLIALPQTLRSVRGDRYAPAEVWRRDQPAALLLPAIEKFREFE